MEPDWAHLSRRLRAGPGSLCPARPWLQSGSEVLGNPSAMASSATAWWVPWSLIGLISHGDYGPGLVPCARPALCHWEPVRNVPAGDGGCRWNGGASLWPGPVCGRVQSGPVAAMKLVPGQGRCRLRFGRAGPAEVPCARWARGWERPSEVVGHPLANGIVRSPLRAVLRGNVAETALPGAGNPPCGFRGAQPQRQRRQIPDESVVFQEL